ncbi:penicillin-binding protein 1A [Arenicella xantha]|uniref:Penicillin-binding protein 1A n=2 Tax=Arenicella xantha TaxID=644221 RepID=A0A395JJ90_9GAMM|nr:penicillin-binding protein 1A [Arenicella xantha]
MVGFITAGFLVVQFSRELPDASQIQGLELKVPLRVYSSENILISEFGDERRKPLAYENIPQTLINAVLASEDDGFFEHGGIDLKGLVRAALSNFKSGSSGQGASTITMQVARNFFLTRDKTYSRKIKEILLAIRLEQLLSKEEILGLYINKIFLGHRAYGFGAAAEVYYGKPINELTLAQTAMLAGLPKAPSTFNPLRNPERATIRRNYVLGRLHELKLITQEDLEIATEEAVSAEKHSRPTGLNAPHIAEMVRAQLTEQFGEEAYWQGLNVYTTIQAKPQLAASKSLRSGLKDYDRRHGFRGPVGKVDLASFEPVDGILDEAYENALSAYPSSQEQVPALILSVTKESAVIWTRDYGQASISLDSAKWARRHKTADLIGDAVKSMTDLVAAGNIVYVEPATTKPATVNATEATAQQIPEQIQWQLSQIPSVSGALISMNPNTGEIISLVGGYDFFLNKYNRAIQSIRQPGSNIKPFIYSASLDQGFTPASLISGAPIVITDPAHGTVWRPENYGGKFYGPTRMREALAKSMNLVSIRLLRAIGIEYAREYVARFGIDMQRFSRSLTMALGSGGATPLEVLNAYSTLANGGYRINPYFIQTITDRNGKILYQAPEPKFCDECYGKYIEMPPLLEPAKQEIRLDDSEQPNTDYSTEANNSPLTADQAGSPSEYEAPRVMSHANNFLTVSMMKDVVQNGTARRAKSLNRTDLAGKTGTTNDYVDAWFTGFNSQIATTVWIGFDDPTTMGRGESGSKAALPIWVDYMQTALKGIPQDSTDLPEYIEAGYVDRATGRRTTEDSPDAIPEYFVVKPLTPEYALYRSLLRTHLDDGTLSAEQFIEQLREEGVQPNQQAMESLDNLGIDGELDPDSLEDESQLIEPEERIIETEEETEGLF